MVNELVKGVVERSAKKGLHTMPSLTRQKFFYNEKLT